jgi:parallel beta-helix repeat protein
MSGSRSLPFDLLNVARRIGVVALFGCTMLVLGAAGRAQAAPCDDLGGTIVGTECQINSPVTASGSFLLPQTLHLLAGGVITVSPEPVGLEIDIAGDFIMDIGSKIDGDVTGNGFIGAAITVNATGNITLHGNGTTGALITSAHKGGCAPPGMGGSVTLNANSDGPPNLIGDVKTEPGSEISVDATACPAGAIEITGVNIDTDGNVHSESQLSGTGAIQRPGGGPITVNATCSLTVSDTGIISSKGRNPGADLVHLEGGCNVVVNGLVQSTGPGHSVPNSPPNHCNGANRPDKPSDSTACIEIWAGDSLEINSTAPHNGEVNADTAQSGGFKRSWIDVFVRGNLNIVGDTVAPYAIHANEFREGSIGGIITVKSRDGAVSADGLAIQANACRLNPADCSVPFNGGRGGEITIEAGGPILPQFPSGDVNLHAASIQARGANQGGGSQAGGQIEARSFNGQVLGAAPGVLDASGGGGGGTPGTVMLTACTANPSGTYTGTVIPAPPITAVSCGGQPTFAAYVVLKPCLCQGGAISVDKQCNCAPLGPNFVITISGDPNGVCNVGAVPLLNVTLSDNPPAVFSAPPLPIPTLAPGQCVPYQGTYLIPLPNPPATITVTDIVTATGTIQGTGQMVTATSQPASCECIPTPPPNCECPEDLTRVLTSTVGAPPAGCTQPNFATVQDAVDAAGPDAVIGLFGSTTENVVIGDAKKLTVTQCTVAKINAADGNLPVVSITSTQPVLIIGPDTFGGTVGWSVESDGHELRGVRASGASDAGIVVSGDHNSVSWNSVSNSAEGVRVDGDLNKLRGGTVENNAGTGVEFSATANNNSLSGATVRNNGGDGILVDGTGNKLKSNKASNNGGNEFDIGPGNINQGSNKANGAACNFGAAGGICN